MSICEISSNIINDDNNLDYDILFYKQMGNSLPVVISLSDLIRELNLIFESDYINVEMVHYLMKTYKSNPADWKKYAKFDRYRYTRNLVASGNGKYNLMALCWGEGHGSAIHDHADSHCFMKLLQGSLDEVRFAWPEKEGCDLKQIGRRKLNLNEVAYMSDSLGLHRVENVSNVDTCISLHLYCPPYNECSVFNQQTGQKTTCGVTFYSMFGKRIKENKEIPAPEDN